MKKIKIDVIIPNSGKTKEMLKERKELLDSFAGENTEVIVECIKKGPLSLESSYDDVQANPYILEKVEKAVKIGSSAIIIYCFGDPGLIAARELVEIPIIGPGETSLHMACILGNRFSIISSLRGEVSRVREIVKRAKIDFNCLASVRGLGISVLKLRDNPQFTIEETVKIGNKCIKEDKAEVLVLGCLGFAGFGKQVQEKLGIPVVDPAAVSLKMAELSAMLHLSHSKIAFPLPTSKGG